MDTEQAKVEEQKRLAFILEDYLLAKEYDLIEERKRIGKWLKKFEITVSAKNWQMWVDGNENLLEGKPPVEETIVDIKE